MVLEGAAERVTVLVEVLVEMLVEVMPSNDACEMPIGRRGNDGARGSDGLKVAVLERARPAFPGGEALEVGCLLRPCSRGIPLSYLCKGNGQQKHMQCMLQEYNERLVQRGPGKKKHTPRIAKFVVDRSTLTVRWPTAHHLQLPRRYNAQSPPSHPGFLER